MKSDAIIGAVEGVTKKWAKQRRREEREASAALNRRAAMTRRPHVSVKDAAWWVMEKAYNKASAGGIAARSCPADHVRRARLHPEHR